ncbi:MAG: hypothetical protein R6X02_28315 [Enhygromyxa sp.]
MSPTSHPPRDRLVRRLGAVLVALLLSLLFVHPAAAGSDPQRFGFGHSMRIEQGERVDMIVTVGGDLTVLGEVEDDAVVVGGTLELGPEARVGGDAVAIGGSVIAARGATIGGDRVEIDGAYRRSPDDAGISGLATSFATFMQVVGSFLISVLLLAFAPRPIQGVATLMRERPGRATLFGLAILLLFLPLLGALTISVIGIPLIPVAIMLLAALLAFGMAALGLSLGYVMPFYSEDRSAMGALALGYLVIAVVALIPWVGAVVVPLAGLFAAGAVLASWFGSRGKRVSAS